MGAAMFLLVPFVSGFAIGLVAPRRSSGMAAMVLAAIVSLVILVAGGREGVLCAILAFPLLLVGLFIGLIISEAFLRYVKARFRTPGAPTAMLVAMLPLIVIAGHRVEMPALNLTRHETVTNSVRLHSTREQVWANIQSIDSIDVRKPWLMYIGLPVPVSCTISRTGVGAKRTCYFENGSIEETVTEWSPPHLLRLSIDRTRMPGRHWLGFESAFYEVTQDGDDTMLTRTTTISSHLYPVWYWRYFERLGVAAEHDYILRNVQQRIAIANASY